ncbi:MAG TPA: alkaline phosphatase PhoX [Blastocatellia bacterium]|nr:alkaline phosphatase PhoX [Blastocatellia bacterium]
MRLRYCLQITTVAVLITVAAFASNAVPSEVTTANARAGHPDTLVARGFQLVKVAEGSEALENPSGTITHFGLLNDAPPQPVERTRTEPDENTYLIFEHGLGGPTPGFDYGTRFLFQGHENGNGMAYITRINLDVTDPAHRITLLTPVGADGKTGFSSIDGSTWDPFTQTLLFTSESGTPTGGVIEVTPNWPPLVRRLDGIIGSSAFEGIHPDKDGNLIIIEDAGGATVNVVRGDATSAKTARQPNSFVYLFVPGDKRDLSKGGKLYAMQVWVNNQPLTFHASDPVGDVFSDKQLKLHTPGSAWPFRWVLLHDTDADGTAPFNANALAKAAGATPLKRPENAAFQPSSDFNTFFFDTTGDTNATAGAQPELAARGAWGAIWRVDLTGPNLDGGMIAIVVLGDQDHAAFDNLAFADARTLLAAEDRGDTLHKQLNLLDSVWAFTVRGASDDGLSAARRFIALGRDTDSEADAALLDASTAGFQNDGDNEPTGLHISDGATSIQRLQGRRLPPQATRWFITQQHGKNTVYQITRAN